MADLQAEQAEQDADLEALRAEFNKMKVRVANAETRQENALKEAHTQIQALEAKLPIASNSGEQALIQRGIDGIKSVTKEIAASFPDIEEAVTTSSSNTGVAGGAPGASPVPTQSPAGDVAAQPVAPQSGSDGSPVAPTPADSANPDGHPVLMEGPGGPVPVTGTLESAIPASAAVDQGTPPSTDLPPGMTPATPDRGTVPDPTGPSAAPGSSPVTQDGTVVPETAPSTVASSGT